MEILKNDIENKIILDIDNKFQTDLGWEESIQEYELDILDSIINPLENYETVRYTHKPYNSKDDIWYYFYFYNNSSTHAGGLNYELLDIKADDNRKLTNSNNPSFFRLEFYKTPNNVLPNRGNRKLAFTKMLLIASGERVLYKKIYDYNYVPIFRGTSYRNNENSDLYWFYEDDALNGSVYSGNTFYLTAKFYNTLDGSIYNFTNKSLLPTKAISEENDVYYKLIIDKATLTYQIFDLSNNRIGITDNPIRFYESPSKTNTI